MMPMEVLGSCNRKREAGRKSVRLGESKAAKGGGAGAERGHVRRTQIPTPQWPGPTLASWPQAQPLPSEAPDVSRFRHTESVERDKPGSVA